MSALEPAIRTPVVAGSFYPGSTGELAETVDQLLEEAAQHPSLAGSRGLRGVIVPHAGYRYSGPVAATAYALLAAAARTPSSVVILGPSHFEPLQGLAVPTDAAWSTPLGVVGLDDGCRRALLSAGAVADDMAHRSEHSIEVQLPFLQHCFDGVPVLPVAVGAGSATHGAELLAEALPAGAVVVVSTDLSHYHDAGTARRLDEHTAAVVEDLAVDELGYEDACGADALRVGMAWARRMGFDIQRLDLRNSADTAGDPSRVVGYGAFVISDQPSP